MSYKLNLSDLDRGASASVTQQLVDRISSAIDDGMLAPGEKLPPTRDLAADAAINHLTAARVYRRLAERGYVTASVGRGTFVRTAPPSSATEALDDDWQLAILPERRTSLAAEALMDSFRITHDRKDIISLAAGFPSPDLAPAAQLARITAEVFDHVGRDALAYIDAEGLPELREELARRGTDSGFASDAEELLVVSGARQGIDLVTRALLRPGDVAVVESPTFVGALASLQQSGARVLGVGIDEQGFDVDALERILARHEVKLVVLQTASQNPTGRDLCDERAERLIALARKHSFFVLEDGVYATIRFDGAEPRRLRRHAPGHVIYVDSLSKTIGGGLRIGWIAGRGPALARLTALKMDDDMFTATLNQHVAARYLASGEHERQLARGVPHYRERRDALLGALKLYLGDEARWLEPIGGHHVWVTLRRPIEERTLWLEALRTGVAFTPGSATMVEPGTRTALRLSFSMLPPDRLEEGVRRLARAVRAAHRVDRRAASAPLS
jgi:GntR family transcriptional regulator of abcA and norABC